MSRPAGTQQLSIIGFDNIPESATTTPTLTTVAQPIREMGMAAVDMLLTLIKGGTPADTHLTFPTRLVQRESTAKRSGRSASS